MNGISKIEILEFNKPLFAEKKKNIEAAKLLKIVKKDSESFEFTKDGKLEKLGIAIFYDYKVQLDKSIIIRKSNKDISENQELKLSVFMAKLDVSLRPLKTYIFLQKINIQLVCLDATETLDKIVRNKQNMNSKESNNENVELHIDAITPIYKLNQLIVNDTVKTELLNTVKLVKSRKKIYEDWGFSSIEPIPHCVINLYGPPGTGKTMSAHILANELGLKILPLNYADIESKFVGDAPKKLISAFNIAEQQNSLLFFDEADSFLGKRITNVSASSDQAINSLRSQLLILLESKNVITVFATNLIENYDKAFHSRILKSIKFELPDLETRKKIISKMIPEDVPLKNEERTTMFFTKLAELTDGFSPREIKNAVLNTLIEGCEGNITSDLFISVFKKQKDIFDDINKHDKKHLSETIKKSLKNNDFSVGSTKNENKQEKKNGRK